jgi:magnesium-transporting ATPase (P-type)
MFWKNILLVFPIWFFGFFSYFSGTAIYEMILYQLFNVAFTAIPIIWYAVFDWEYSKETLLEKPKYYRIGLQDKHFNIY